MPGGHSLFFYYSISVYGRIIEEVSLLPAEVAGIAFDREDLVIYHCGHDADVIPASVLIPVEEYEVSREEAAKDVAEFLAALKQMDII